MKRKDKWLIYALIITLLLMMGLAGLRVVEPESKASNRIVIFIDFGSHESFAGKAPLDVSASFFWASPEQRLLCRWLPAEHGIDASLALYATVECGQVAFTYSQRPAVKATNGWLAPEREHYKTIGTFVAKGVFTIGRAPLFLCITRPLPSWLVRGRSPPAILLMESNSSVQYLPLLPKRDHREPDIIRDEKYNHDETAL